MFTSIAPRYDLLNHLLSFNIDRIWRRRTARTFAHILRRPHSQVLDLCCGTGDLSLALSRQAARTDARFFGADFSHAMLQRAAVKSTGTKLCWIEADALSLPFADSSFDLVTAAFGFRNLANYEHGLMEMRRILKPGGLAAILEFSQPTSPVFAAVYGFYSRRILPVIGGAISGAKEAYTYLPESVRKFPTGEHLAHDMRRAGFRDVRFTHMTGGVVALHTGIV